MTRQQSESFVISIESLIEAKIGLAIDRIESRAETSDMRLRLYNRVDEIKEELAKKLED